MDGNRHRLIDEANGDVTVLDHTDTSANRYEGGTSDFNGSSNKVYWGNTVNCMDELRGSFRPKPSSTVTDTLHLLRARPGSRSPSRPMSPIVSSTLSTV